MFLVKLPYLDTRDKKTNRHVVRVIVCCLLVVLSVDNLPTTKGTVQAEENISLVKPILLLAAAKRKRESSRKKKPAQNGDKNS